ncbi:MAG: hypothetical protein GX249_09940 [Firmicutes bacterium]|nr:hypothetical protein [Bacillota bacterium]
MGIAGNISLLAMLVVVISVIFYVRRQTNYTLDVQIEPPEAAKVSEITYTRIPGGVVAECSLRIKEGYSIQKWTGTPPRLEGYDSARWYDAKKQRVRLEIDRNETVTIHFEQKRD